MDIRTPLIAYFEPTKAIEPGKCALDHPPIAPQSFTRLDATPSDARDDASSAQRLPTTWIVVALIRMQFHWSLAWSSSALAWQTQRRDGVNGVFEPLGIVHIGPRDGYRQGHAVTVHHHMALRAQLAAIRRILAGLFAPPGAGTLALSSDARVQSMRPASCSRCRSVRCRRFHTPASCQSLRRRQHVIPLPHPSSWGSISHEMPDFKTKMMPLNAARSLMLRGRPPLGFGGSGGRSGATISHSASLINGVLMPVIYHTA
jgi:hypothetical protein